MNEQQERRINRVQQNARIGLVERMKAREEAIISKLVLAYRGGKLNSEALFGGIAAIAEIRSIVIEAEQDYSRAAATSKDITGA